MELPDLRTEVDDLKLMLLNLFINKYFDDLRNKLDIKTTEFEIKKQKKTSKRFKLNNEDSIDCKGNLSDNIDKTNNWRQRRTQRS